MKECVGTSEKGERSELMVEECVRVEGSVSDYEVEEKESGEERQEPVGAGRV